MCRCWRPRRNVTVLLLGLDGAGKTSFLYALKRQIYDPAIPTMGFDKDTLKERGCTVQLYDLGGGRTIRSIWKNFTAESHGFIFLVDASNQERLEEAKTVLTDTFDTGFLSGKPILFVANKQVLP